MSDGTTCCLGRVCSVVVEAAMLAAGAWHLTCWWVSMMVVSEIDSEWKSGHLGPRPTRD
jgi:hypothetical protein